MTSEERLKIAEEFIKARGWRDIHVGGLWVTFAPGGNGGWCVYHSSGPPADPIACHEDQLEALYQARQRLAAEREAAMTPNERKYKAALESIYSYLVGVYGKDHRAVVTAREALKEST